MVVKPFRAPKTLKKGIDANDCRKRRSENAVQIRRTRKSEFLAKRRYSDPQAITELPYAQQYESQETFRILSQAFVSIKSTIPHERLWAAQALRWAISVKGIPVEDALALDTSAELLKNLVSLTKYDNRAEVHLEVIWVLSQVAGGKMTKRIFDAGAIHTIMKLLQSPNPVVVEECLGCIANSAGDSSEARDQIVQIGGLEMCLQIVTKLTSKRSLQHGAWALSNLVGSTYTSESTLLECARTMLRLMQQHLDEKVLSESCWTLAHITDKRSESCCKIIVESQCLPTLVRFLAHNNYLIVLPCLHTLSNIIATSYEGREILISSGVLRSFANLLERLTQFTKSQTVWNANTSSTYRLTQRMRIEISKMVTCLAEQPFSLMVDHIVKCDGLVNLLAQEILEGEWDIKRSALVATISILRACNNHQLYQAVSSQVIQALSSMLGVSDVEVLLATIDCLDTILSVGASEGYLKQQYPFWVEESGGLDKLEALQEHQSALVYSAAVHMIEKHFNGCEDVETDMIDISPTHSAVSNSYNFGFPVHNCQAPPPAW